MVLCTLGSFIVGCTLAMLAWWKELAESDAEASWLLKRLKAALMFRKPLTR
jgi:hypothetical protein